MLIGSATMVDGSENREMKYSNICVGRGESRTYAVNQSLCRQGRRNVGVEKWNVDGNSQVMQLPSKAAVRRILLSSRCQLILELSLTIL